MSWRLSPWHGLCCRHGVANRLSASHGLKVFAMAYAVAMAWLTGCRHHMAHRLSPWRGSEVVSIAWHGGCCHGSEVVGMAWRLSPWSGSQAVVIAWLEVVGMAWRLLPWSGSQAVGIAWLKDVDLAWWFSPWLGLCCRHAWLTGCRHRMARRLSPWLKGCRHRMAWRLSLEVVGMAWRLSPWHGLCFCHGVAHRLSALHGSQVVAMAWLTDCRHRMARRLLAWHGGC
jgi:AraC-like DNA-binding protein